MIFMHKKSPLQLSKDKLQAINDEIELKANETAIAQYETQRSYDNGDACIKSRLDAIEEQKEYQKKQRHFQEFQKQYIAQHKEELKQKVYSKLQNNEGMRYFHNVMKIAKPQSLEQCIKGVTESLFDNMAEFPYPLALILDIENMTAIPTMIRELYPYKQTILRTLAMLDFARWCCRVISQECPTARALIKGKTNFIVGGGYTHKVIAKDGEKDTTKYQDIIDAFNYKNKAYKLEKEIYSRSLRDGEAFVLFEPAVGEPSEVACVEPDYIRPSQLKGTNQEDPTVSFGIRQQDWSMGILTKHHKYHLPVEYQIVWNDNEEQTFKAEDVFHPYFSDTQNAKRGLPPLLDLIDDFVRITQLRKNLANSSIFRASIAGVEEFEVAIPKANPWPGHLGEHEERGFEYVRELKTNSSTNILQLSPGRKWATGPQAPDGGTLQLVYQWHLQAIAAATQTPEWLVAGTSGEGHSFAASLTSESPSVREFQVERKMFTDISRDMDLREIKQQTGMEIDEFLKDYDIEVSGDSVITRDSKAEMETAIMAIEKGISSIYTAQSELGFNPEFETNQRKKEVDEGILLDVSNQSMGTQQMMKTPNSGGTPSPDAQRQNLEGSQKQQ